FELPIEYRGLIRACERQQLLCRVRESARAVKDQPEPLLLRRLFCIVDQQFKLCLYAGQGSAQLVGCAFEKAALFGTRARNPGEQAIERFDDTADFDGYPIDRQRREVARGSPVDLCRDISERRERKAYTEPDQQENDAEFGGVDGDGSREYRCLGAVALVQRFADRDGHGVGTGEGAITHEPDRLTSPGDAAASGIGARSGQLRQVGVAVDQRATGSRDPEVD